MKKNESVNIDLVKFQKAMNFAAKKDVRYYLLGVCIQPCPLGGTMIVGTDGHVLGVFHDPQGKCDSEVILSLKNKRDIAQFIKDGAVRAVITRNEDDVVEFRLYNEAQCKGDCQHAMQKARYPVNKAIIEARYPGWERLMPAELPKTEKPLVDGVRVQNLERFAFSRKVDKSHAGIRLYPTGKEKVMVVFIHKEPDFIGLIMPTRYDQKDQDSWWLKLARQRKEALKKAA